MPRCRARRRWPGPAKAGLLGLALALFSAIPLANSDAAHQARADFRPLGRAEDLGSVNRRPYQPLNRTPGFDRRATLPNLTADRAGSRKAVPLTRGQELGLRFRPDDRDPLHDSRLSPSPVPGVRGEAAVTDGFRPIPRRSRPTYEAMEAQRRSAASADGVSPGYPGLALPPGMPIGRPWPRW